METCNKNLEILEALKCSQNLWMWSRMGSLGPGGILTSLRALEKINKGDRPLKLCLVIEIFKWVCKKSGKPIIILPICEKRQGSICEKAFFEVLLIVLEAKTCQHASCSSVIYILSWWLREFLAQLQFQQKMKDMSWGRGWGPTFTLSSVIQSQWLHTPLSNLSKPCTKK